MPAPVVVRDLRHVYPAARRGAAERTALDGVRITVEDGSVFGLLGPNGGGKTTLFKIVSTLMKPTSGTVEVFGTNVVHDPLSARSQIGVVFQSPARDKKLTVRENLRHAGHIQGISGSALEFQIDSLLARFGVDDRDSDRVEELSGGLARRVDIARGLLHDPKLLILDEPSTGLDPGARHHLWDHLEALRRETRVTILLTTHYPSRGV